MAYCLPQIESWSMLSPESCQVMSVRYNSYNLNIHSLTSMKRRKKLEQNSKCEQENHSKSLSDSKTKLILVPQLQTTRFDKLFYVKVFGYAMT